MAEVLIKDRLVGIESFKAFNQVPSHSSIVLFCSQESDNDFHLYKIAEYLQTCYSSKQDHRFRNEEVLKTVIFQLAHAVHHLHQNGQVHNHINQENIHIAKGKILLCHPTPTREVNEASKGSEYEKDIRDLAVVFQHILHIANTKGKIDSYDAELANYLLEVMDQAKTTTTEILQHPFFWDENRKLNFLSQICQFTKSNNGYGMKQKLAKISTEVFGCHGWIKKLEITDYQEREEYRIQLQQRMGRRSKDYLAIQKSTLSSKRLPSLHLAKTKRKVSVGANVIKQMAVEVNRGTAKLIYCQDDVNSLMNFIRNQREHFWERSKVVQACFHFNFSHGVWQFFRRRYPNLLTAVHRVVKKEHDEWDFQGLTELYFETMAPNKDLPTFLEDDSKIKKSHTD